MKIFVTTAALTVLATVLTLTVTTAHAQTFTNLDFEAASVPAPAPGITFLDWGTAVPGWSHSAGADTSSVYHGGTHVGLTQWFLLVDAGTPGGPLAGAYALRFVSGYDSSNPSGAQWVNAYIAQTGMVPVSSSSLTLLASGPLAVSMNGHAIALQSIGGLAYAADVSPYAGQNVEMRFTNTSLQFSTAVTLDNVAFSASQVPEPPVWLLFGLALAGSTLRCAAKTGQRHV